MVHRSVKESRFIEGEEVISTSIKVRVAVLCSRHEEAAKLRSRTSTRPISIEDTLLSKAVEVFFRAVA